MNLLTLLESSSASPKFVEAVRAFLKDGRSNDGVIFSAGSPPVKVRRTLTRVLEAYPADEIERVEINASSGCEYYRGELVVHRSDVDGPREVHFHWDCRWRAEQEGWTDYFGFPDQIRAAREYDHDCFRDWEERPVEMEARA